MSDKQAFLENQETRLEEWRKKMDKLRSAAGRVEDGERAEHNRQVANLHLELKSIEEKILEIKLSGDDFKEKSEGEIEEAWSRLSRDFSAVVSDIQ
jgi:hypothetical protein